MEILITVLNNVLNNVEITFTIMIGFLLLYTAIQQYSFVAVFAEQADYTAPDLLVEQPSVIEVVISLIKILNVFRYKSSKVTIEIGNAKITIENSDEYELEAIVKRLLSNQNNVSTNKVVSGNVYCYTVPYTVPYDYNEIDSRSSVIEFQNDKKILKNYPDI